MKPTLLVILLTGFSLLLQAQPAEEERAIAAVRNSPDSVDIYATRLVAFYEAAGNDTSAFQFYLHLGTEYLDAGNTPKTIESFRKASRLASEKKLGYQHLWALNDSFGMVYGNRGMYDSARWYHNEAATVAATDTIKVVSSLRKLGLQYNSLGQPVQALSTYLQALALLERKPAMNLQASIFNNLGILYEDDGNLPKAEEYYVKAAALFKELKNPRSNFNILNNLGILYSMQGKNDESLNRLAEAEALLPELKGELETAIVNLNVGNTLAHMGRAEESIGRFEKSMKIFVSIQDMYGIALCHRQLGEALHLVGRNAEGEKHEFLSLELSKKNGFTALIQDSYYDLARIYEARRDFQNAYKYYKLTTHLKDSVNDKEKQAKLGLLEKEFELSRQEEERERLEEQNEIQKVRARANQNAQIALAVGLGLFIFAAVVAGVAWLRTRKQNVILAEQKAKIEEQAGQLVEAARNKSKFFANVSHELRTPITLLNGMLELMQEGTYNGSREKLRVAVSNSRRLQNLVDEVLDLSRLEVGKATLQTRQLHILPLMNRIVLAFESFLVRKGIRLEYEATALEEAIVDIDEDKFEKILNNLLYNAIKFNKTGGWIRVKGELSPGGKEVHIDVSDSGIGIPETDLPRIFERFYQSTSGDGKNAQGIGIGLSLVKEFTELHNGTVSVSSVVDEGTTFRLSFLVSTDTPLEAEVDTLETSLPVSVSFDDFKEKPSVFIVEDNDEMRFYVKEILGQDVILYEASNGQEAVRLLETKKPDLIVSDVMMPEMNGYEFLAHLKSNDALKTIPVIMLTARASEEDRLSGLSLGVDDYIIKPFNARELKSRIHNLLMNQLIRNQWKEKPVEKDEELPVAKEDDAFVRSVESYVETRLSDSTLSMGDLADHLAMSERQLYRKCGAATGMSPAQLVKEIRLKVAYRMLIQKEVSKVAALAASVGFDNSAYFSRQFLERYGKRPVEFL